MLRFLLGVAVGMAVARGLQTKTLSSTTQGMRGGLGRVDELSSAAEHLPGENAEVNAGDGTGPGEMHAAAGRAMDESGTFEPQRPGFPMPSAEGLRADTRIGGQGSESFNGA
ncbi:MAG TPA: hypothetical protein VFP68_18395 [Burkholderiaceae bacterium]|nr:hypothetical protein [Burkholderiaceae bacterium]